MKIAIGSDHAGFDCKMKIMAHLSNNGHSITNCGAYDEQSTNYAPYAQLVAKCITTEEAAFGILICKTGIGMSIAANKIRGIRAALCVNTRAAVLARAHNDSNILVLGNIYKSRHADIVDAFLSTSFEGGRHIERIRLIEEKNEAF